VASNDSIHSNGANGRVPAGLFINVSPTSRFHTILAVSGHHNGVPSEKDYEKPAEKHVVTSPAGAPRRPR
jgi:hypothetical protein